MRKNRLKNTEKYAKSGDGEVMKSVLTSVFSFGRGNGKMNSVFLRLSAEQKLRKTGNRQKNMEESRKIDLQIYRGCDILFSDRLYPFSENLWR